MPAKLRTIAVIGALATDGLSALGSWRAQGKAEEVVTILAGITAAAPESLKVLSAPGADPRNHGPRRHRRRGEARAAADLTVLVIGEDFDLSGEARSRSDLELPAEPARARAPRSRHRQARGGRAGQWPPARDAVAGRAGTGHPRDLDAGRGRRQRRRRRVVRQIFAGGPPARRVPASHRCRAVLLRRERHRPSRGSRPGERHGALSRPADHAALPLRSRPLVQRVPLQRSRTEHSRRWRPGERIDISITVENVGGVASDEVVQFYVRDPVASIARPVLELRGFKRIELGAGRAQAPHLQPDAGTAGLLEPARAVAHRGRAASTSGWAHRPRTCAPAVHSKSRKHTWERRRPRRCPRESRSRTIDRGESHEDICQWAALRMLLVAGESRPASCAVPRRPRQSAPTTKIEEATHRPLGPGHGRHRPQ